MYMLAVVEILKKVTPGIIDRSLCMTAVMSYRRTGYGKKLAYCLYLSPPKLNGDSVEL